LGVNAPIKVEQENKGQTKVIVEYADGQGSVTPLTPAADTGEE
jgi:hypothetical protein